MGLKVSLIVGFLLLFAGCNFSGQISAIESLQPKVPESPRLPSKPPLRPSLDDEVVFSERNHSRDSRFVFEATISEIGSPQTSSGYVFEGVLQ